MVSRETPELPEWLDAHGERLEQFADLLATAGVDRGLIGPREVPRIWQRHLLNCAVVADPAHELVPESAQVADVGSGAGLPGLVWAIVRPDITMVLVEPLLRRATYLAEAIATLELSDRVTVRRDRAEDVAKDAQWPGMDVVTARAVAPLDRLIGWTVPLLRPGGGLVALKGSNAADEVASARASAAAAGVQDLRVAVLAADYLDVPTTVITGVRRTAE